MKGTASKNDEEHLIHLKTLFERLMQHGLTIKPIKPAKCIFGVPTLQFLCHAISPNDIMAISSNT